MDWHSLLPTVGATFKSFFDSDFGTAFALTTFLVAYIATLGIAVRRFAQATKRFGPLRAEIEKNSKEIESRRYSGGQPSVDLALMHAQNLEKSVKGDDYKIDNVSTLLMVPILRAATVGFLAAPVPLLFLLGSLGSLYSHFPKAYAALGLQQLTSSDLISGAIFTGENVARAIDLQIAEALHLNSHFYPASMDVLALSLLVWPLQLLVMLYLFLSFAQVYSLTQTIQDWTNERNRDAKEARDYLSANNKKIRYRRLKKNLGAGLLSTLFSPIRAVFHRIQDWRDGVDTPKIAGADSDGTKWKWVGRAVASLWLVAMIGGAFLAVLIGQSMQQPPSATTIARIVPNRHLALKPKTVPQFAVFVVHFAKNGWSIGGDRDAALQIAAASTFIEKNYPGATVHSNSCKDFPRGTIRIVGESDRGTGTAAYNRHLSGLRAASVEHRLQADGISDCVITTEADGDLNFIPETDEATASSHRRASINIEIRQAVPTG